MIRVNKLWYVRHQGQLYGAYYDFVDALLLNAKLKRI
jgi:hypothetical protein